MTSRERLLAVLKGELPDRVPISTYELQPQSTASWENHEPSYAPLMAFIEQHCDTMMFAGTAGWRFAEGQTEVETWTEGDWTHHRTLLHSPLGDLTTHHASKADVVTTWTLEHALKTPDDIDKYLALDFQLGDVDMSGFFAEQDRLGEAGILLPGVADPVCIAAEAFEMSQFLLYSITDTDKMLYFLDALGERLIEQLRLVCEAGKQSRGERFGEVLFRLCGPEYVTPPYLSPKYFNRFVTRYVKPMADLIHEAGAMMRYHSHGKIRQVLDEIMATEPDGIDPLEGPPDGDIDLAELKRLIGDRTCLFGNLQLKLLEHGTPQQVRETVIQCMQDAKEGGRYVIMPTAAPINIPLAPQTDTNYRVFIETALEYGGY